MKLPNLFKSVIKTPLSGGFSVKNDNLLEEYVGIIKQIFNKADINVSFYIAGGSIYSTLKGLKNFNDIDVFFYNKSDLNVIDKLIIHINKTSSYNKTAIDDLMTAAVSNSFISTDNALTLTKETIKTTLGIDSSYDIQLIKRRVGHYNEVLSTFDLTCSMFAYTSDNKLIKNVNVNDSIDVNLEEFKDNTLKRYTKYLLEKGSIDLNDITLKKILNYLLDNIDTKITQAIISEGSKYTHTGAGVIHAYAIHAQPEHVQIIHDIVCERYKDEEIIDVFNKLNINVVNLQKPSDEYIVHLTNVFNDNKNHIGHLQCLMLNYSPNPSTKNNSFYNNLHINYFDDKLSAKNKYPEYFL